MIVEEMLEACFDPLICNQAQFLTGRRAGATVRGIFDELERAIPMGKAKISAGFATFAAKTSLMDGVVPSDEIKIEDRFFVVHSLYDDLFGMSVLTVMEIEGER